MSINTKLRGTSKTDFSVEDLDHGIRVSENEIALYDPVSGEQKLSSLLATTPFPFTTLTDVPSDYTGHSGQSVRVKSTEDGLEFVPAAIVLPMIEVPFSVANDGVPVESTLEVPSGSCVLRRLHCVTTPWDSETAEILVYINGSSVDETLFLHTGPRLLAPEVFLGEEPIRIVAASAGKVCVLVTKNSATTGAGTVIVESIIPGS